MAFCDFNADPSSPIIIIVILLMGTYRQRGQWAINCCMGLGAVCSISINLVQTPSVLYCAQGSMTKMNHIFEAYKITNSGLCIRRLIHKTLRTKFKNVPTIGEICVACSLSVQCPRRTVCKMRRKFVVSAGYFAIILIT